MLVRAAGAGAADAAGAAGAGAAGAAEAGAGAAGAAPQARNAAAKPAKPAKPLRVRATELFTLYEQLLERAGLETQFHMANSLVRRLKGDFALFANGTSRDRSGSYFAAQNEAGLYKLAEQLDAQYRFDPTLWAIESDGLQRLQTEAYVGDESEEKEAEGFEKEAEGFEVEEGRPDSCVALPLTAIVCHCSDRLFVCMQDV